MKKKSNTDREVNNVSSTATKTATPKTQISEETKQICADLKTEKTKEYLDSIWDYNLNSALNYNEEGTGTFILNALKIAL